MIGYTGACGDEHLGEHDTIAHAQRDEPGDLCDVGAVVRHGESPGQGTECPDQQCHDQRESDAESRRHLAMDALNVAGRRAGQGDAENEG
jgi:hypothetical protein